MGKNIFLFENNSFARFVPFLVGFMIFLATIFIVGGKFVTNIGDRWSDGIDDSMIVQVVIDENLDREANQDTLNRTLMILNQTQGIKKAVLVNNDDTMDMLEPWLGSGIMTSELPIPNLIQVEKDNDYEINMDLLKDELQQISPNILIDDYADWREKISNIVSNINNFIYSLIFLTLASTALLVITLTRGLMLVNTHTLNMLILMGATDKFIMNDFVWGSVRLILKSSVMGFVFGVIFVNLMFLINDFDLEISTLNWVATFMIVPLVFVLGFMTSSITVRMTLRKRFFKINF